MAIGPMQLLIVLLIVILLFGTKKIASLGSDLGVPDGHKGPSDFGADDVSGGQGQEHGQRDEQVV